MRNDLGHIGLGEENHIDRSFDHILNVWLERVDRASFSFTSLKRAAYMTEKSIWLLIMRDSVN